MRWGCLGGCALILLTGCGQAYEGARSSADFKTAAPAAGESEPGYVEMVDGTASSPAIVERKVIYNASLDLVVKDFAPLETEIPKLVKQAGGFLADVSVNRTQGLQRSGTWQARIPVDKFEQFLDDVSELGIPENRRQTAQDVTEEFVDLEARIANQKRLEERIVELLDSSSDEIKDVIEVERELGRVRGEIEQMEGRLRYLTNRTDLTTITITAREERDYVPPAAPSFTGRIREAWANSLLELKNFGADLAVAVVYLTPWLVILAVLVATFVLGLKWLIGKSKRKAAS